MALILDRRAALFAGLAAAWTIPTVAAAQGAVLAWTPRGVSMDDARTLAAACERIAPATSTPGAAACGVPQFVDQAIAGWCTPAETQLLKAGLARLDANARSNFGVAFASATLSQQDILLTDAEAEARAAGERREAHYFPLLRDLVTTGYFQSRPGTTVALRYDPNPGEYRACVPLKEIGRAWALS
jgi:gluconate 2-dehydrogenase gamma chain